MECLDLPYSKSLILSLLGKNGVTMSSLQSIATSYNTEHKLIQSCQKHWLVNITDLIAGRKTRFVSLTSKGLLVAEQLRKAEAAAKGATIFKEEGRAEVRVPEEWREKWKNLHALFHVNVYEDHVTIMETNHGGTGKERIFNIYVRENGHGHMRLWCEEDESFDCYHVGYALTFEPVQEMFVRVRGGK